MKLARDGSKDRPANLFFSTDVEEEIAKADLIFVAVNTPTKTTGFGANQAADMSYFMEAIQTIARVRVQDTIIVEKSTVPCGTAKWAKETLEAVGHPNARFEILSNPEFLAEGTAVFNLLHPDRILIGCDSTPSGQRASDSLRGVYESWVSPDRIVTINTQSAELAKLAANALLAQRVSSINALSAICEPTGADIDEVAFACGLDLRIGPRMLKASVGYGGSCFKKDVLNLAHFSSTLGLPNISAYWKSVDDINESQKDRFAQRVITGLHNTLKNKRVAVFGFAFKKNTGDTRESAAIAIVARLIAEASQVRIFDPRVKAEDVWISLEYALKQPRSTFESHVNICASANEACIDAVAVVITTEWDQFSNKSLRLVPLAESEQNSTAKIDFPDIQPFKTSVHKSGAEGLMVKSRRRNNTSLSSLAPSENPVDWAHVASLMRYPKIVFDGRNIIDSAKLAQLGFQVEPIGKASVRPQAGFHRAGHS